MTGATETVVRSPAADNHPAPTYGWVVPLVVLIAGMFMSILDISIINVALPTIQNEFGATTTDAQWVITGYSLAEGIVVPATAWFGDRFGLSRIYNLALLGFAGGSALCGLAWSLNSLVIFRVVQGILGGVLPTITMSILLRIVPRERFGTALGLYGLGAMVAPAVGPALGGYLVQYVSWRLIFFINVPVGILGVIAAILVLPAFPMQAKRRFDVLGFLTVATGLFTLLLAVSKGEDWKWSSYRILGLITVSVLSLALFVVIELEVDDPLLDLRVFRYWPFTLSLLLIAILSVVIYSVVFLVPQFLQRGQGLGAFDAGLVLLPPALVMAVFMPLTGRIYDRIGARWPATIGLVITTGASYLLHTMALGTSRGTIMWMLALQYGGLGMSMMPIFSAGLAVIPTAHSNVASALNNVVQRVAAAFGVAVFTAILTAQQAQLMAGRAALVPMTTPIQHLGPPGTPDWLSLYAVYQRTTKLVFAGAIDDLFLLVTALLVLSSLVALLLRSKTAPAAPPRRYPPATEAASRALSDVGPAKHDAVEPDPVPATITDKARPTRQPARATSRSAKQHTTVQATGNRTREYLHTTADGLDTVRTRIDQLLIQVATLRQQATDLAAEQTELVAKHEQVEQQHRRPEAPEHCTELTSTQSEPIMSPATIEIARNYGEQWLPNQQTRALGHTGGQKPKLGPSQVKLARQMYDELDKNGKRRYTVQQIADAFGVTPPTIYRHLRKITSKT